MHALQKLIDHAARHGSRYFFLFVILFSLDRQGRLAVTANPGYGPFESDVAEYYDFLPTIFYCDQADITRMFQRNKRTVGMAILYMPAFMIGKMRAGDACSPKVPSHSQRHIDTRSDTVRKGFTKPYHRPIRWESILITLLGLMFCRLGLRKYFPDPIVLLALCCILFGTNLFHYTYSNGEMPHAYLFFLFSAFIYATIQFVQVGKPRNLLWMGLLGGMITLIRPTDVLILIVPLLFAINSWAEFMNRWRLLLRHPLHLAAAVALFFLPILLQMILWKIYVGQFVFYTYTRERFFFNDPQILNFLFSFRKGWLLYTPVMGLALIGIGLARRHLRDFFPLLLIFTVANIYILSSWWDWAFGGSFGARPMIESYALLIFPLATTIAWTWRRLQSTRYLKLFPRAMLLATCYSLIYLNLFQSWQFRWQVIHWSGMNATMYKYTFLKDDTTKEDLDYLHSIATPPDPEQMLNGHRD